jgi:mono/diheme cytochrome c family protein
VRFDGALSEEQTTMRHVVWLGAVALIALVAGCESALDPYPLTETYPVRTDWLVLKIPTAQPTGWFKPGLTPLTLLDRELKADGYGLDLPSSPLRPEIKAKTLLDSRRLTPAQRREFAVELERLFGTPAEPRVPLEWDEPTANKKTVVQHQLRELHDQFHLDPATLARGSKLYRRHCLTCHGVSGAGDGWAGPQLVPAPRDYRSGLFKFTTADVSGLARKPRLADLVRTLRLGLEGSAMPAFSMLGEPALHDLAAYVIHLSLRGEAEFTVMQLVLSDFYEDEPITGELRRALVDLDKAGQPNGIAVNWLKSDRTPIVPTPDPYTTPAAKLAAAAEGYKVFHAADQANCARCHINLGKNALVAYDAWGTVVQPRNLLYGPFRAGKDDEQLYARVWMGIGPAGMPEHKLLLSPTLEDKAKGADRVWQIVHLIQHVSDKLKRTQLSKAYNIEFD